MGLVDEATFNTKWADPSGNFADNTTRAIVEALVREFAEDIKDSLVFRGSADSLTYKIVNIGDWNMDTTSSVTIASGLATPANIRSISVIIISDNNADYSDLCGVRTGGTGTGFASLSTSTGNVLLERVTGGLFDSSLYDSTGFNRGFITLGYVQ